MKEANPMEFSNYYMDGKQYFICDGIVYTNDENGDRVEVDILPSSIQMYGECTDLPLFELLITEIKELKNNQALIFAEDGAGLDFGFIETDFAKNKEKYKKGQKGIYQIVAELEAVEIPEDCEDGVILEGQEAKKFFDWVEDEVEEDATACIGFDDVAVYETCNDFEETGRYNFYGIVSTPCNPSISEEIDRPDLEKVIGFTIPMMNQFNKKDSRFIEATFEDSKFHEGNIEEGWAVKAVLRILALHGKRNNVYEYGTNSVVCPEEKGLFDHDEDEYFEEEDGTRWLMTEEEKEAFFRNCEVLEDLGDE